MLKTKKGAVLIMVIVILQLVVILSAFILLVAVNSSKRGATSIKRIEENIFIDNTAQYFLKNGNMNGYIYDDKVYKISSYADELIIKKDNNNILYVKIKDNKIIEFKVRKDSLNCDLKTKN